MPTHSLGVHAPPTRPLRQCTIEPARTRGRAGGRAGGCWGCMCSPLFTDCLLSSQAWRGAHAGGGKCKACWPGLHLSIPSPLHTLTREISSDSLQILRRFSASAASPRHTCRSCWPGRNNGYMNQIPFIYSARSSRGSPQILQRFSASAPPFRPATPAADPAGPGGQFLQALRRSTTDSLVIL